MFCHVMILHGVASGRNVMHMETAPHSNVLEPVRRVAVSVPEAALALGVSRRTVWALIADRRLRSLQIGRRRLVPIEELARIAAADLRPPHSEVPSA